MTAKVIIDEDWAFSVDQHNNHLPYRKTKVKPKDGEEYYDWRHTGNYYKNTSLLLKSILDTKVREGLTEDVTMLSYLTKYEELQKKFWEVLETTNGGINETN